MESEGEEVEVGPDPWMTAMMADSETEPSPWSLLATEELQLPGDCFFSAVAFIPRGSSVLQPAVLIIIKSLISFFIKIPWVAFVSDSEP